MPLVVMHTAYPLVVLQQLQALRLGTYQEVQLQMKSLHPGESDVVHVAKTTLY